MEGTAVSGTGDDHDGVEVEHEDLLDLDDEDTETDVLWMSVMERLAGVGGERASPEASTTELWADVLQVCTRDPSKVETIFFGMPPPTKAIADQLLNVRKQAAAAAAANNNDNTTEGAEGGGAIAVNAAAATSPAATSSPPQLCHLRDIKGCGILHHLTEDGAPAEVIAAVVEMETQTVFTKAKMTAWPDEKYPIFTACFYATQQGLRDNNNDNDKKDEAENCKKTIKYLMDRGLMDDDDDNDDEDRDGAALREPIDPVLEILFCPEISDAVVAYILEVGDLRVIGRDPHAVEKTKPVVKAFYQERSWDSVIAPLLKDGRLRIKDLPANMLEQLPTQTARSRPLQEALNDATVRRFPTAVLFIDFYCHVHSVTFFIVAANRFLLQVGETTDPFMVFVFTWLYMLAIYFLLREWTQWNFHGLFDYFMNVWNLLDIARIATMIASAICMQTTTGGNDVDRSVRYLLLVTGGFVVQGLVLFVRSTVLDFALFVGGLVMILKTLIPFVLVSVCMVFSFAFMYFTVEFDQADCSEAGFCTLDEAMLTTFNYFFSGPERTHVWWLDLIFGLVVVVILLNVLIAIVSDAWEDGNKISAQVFWAYRIGFIAEVESLSSLPNKPVFRTILSPFLYYWSDRKMADDIDRVSSQLNQYDEATNSRQQIQEEAINGDEGGDGSGPIIVTKQRSYELDNTAKVHLAKRIRDLNVRLETGSYDDYHELRRKLDLLEDLFWIKTGGASFTEFVDLDDGASSGLLAWIDALGEIPVYDRINWTEEPYKTHVGEDSRAYYLHAYHKEAKKSTYRKRHPKLTDEDVDKLCNMASFERNWFFSLQYYREQVDTFDPLVKRPRRVGFEFFVYMSLGVVGFVSFGILWPTRFRQALLSGATEDKKRSVRDELTKRERDLALEQEQGTMEAVARRRALPLRDDMPRAGGVGAAAMEPLEARLNQLEHKVDEMALKLDRIDALVTKLPALSLKLDAVLDMMEVDE